MKIVGDKLNNSLFSGVAKTYRIAERQKRKCQLSFSAYKTNKACSNWSIKPTTNSETNII